MRVDIDMHIDINMLMYLDRDRYSHGCVAQRLPKTLLTEDKNNTEITIGQAQRVRDFGALCLNGM